MLCKDAQADNQFNLINKNNKLHLIFGFHNAGVGGSSPPMTTISSPLIPNYATFTRFMQLFKTNAVIAWYLSS